MLYTFFSFIFCGLAIPCIQHGRTALGVTLIVLSTLMPVVKDTVDQLNPPPPPPITVVSKPDPVNDTRFKSILFKLGELERSVKRCSVLLDEL